MMMNGTAPRPRASDEITAEIEDLGRLLQSAHLYAGARAAIHELLHELRDELVAAVEQEEVTAAELAAQHARKAIRSTDAFGKGGGTANDVQPIGKVSSELSGERGFDRNRA